MKTCSAITRSPVAARQWGAPIDRLVAGCLINTLSVRRAQSFWRSPAKGPMAIKVMGSGLRKCLQQVKALIKKKGGGYFCDPVSCLT